MKYSIAVVGAWDENAVAAVRRAEKSLYIEIYLPHIFLDQGSAERARL